jgi:hypothetical protein
MSHRATLISQVLLVSSRNGTRQQNYSSSLDDIGLLMPEISRGLLNKAWRFFYSFEKSHYSASPFFVELFASLELQRVLEWR